MEKFSQNKLIVACDFDGTLCKDEFPNIGEANKVLISQLMIFRSRGNKLILWTCREGQHLEEAVLWCKSWGLTFDAVNENVDNEFSGFIGAKRKIYAHLYLEDKAMYPSSFGAFLAGLDAID